MPSTEDFKQAVAKTDRPQTFPALLQTLLPQFTAALPGHLKANAERYCRVALTEFRKNPKLAECDPYNVLACALTATQLGLEVGLMGQAYLVPYNNRRRGTMECQLIPGYQGLIALAMRSGMLDSLYAFEVYEGDEFSYQRGTDPAIKHTDGPNTSDETKITHAYAVAKIKGGGMVFEVMPVAKIASIRDAANKIGNSHYSFEHWGEYCRKTAVRRLVKYLPKSAELVMAAEMDELAARGKAQNITVEKIVSGDWVPEHEQESPAPGSPAAKPGLASGPSDQGAGGLSTADDVFAACDAAIKAKDWDLARDLSRSKELTPAMRKMLEDQIPKAKP